MSPLRATFGRPRARARAMARWLGADARATVRFVARTGRAPAEVPDGLDAVLRPWARAVARVRAVAAVRRAGLAGALVLAVMACGRVLFGGWPWWLAVLPAVMMTGAVVACGWMARADDDEMAWLVDRGLGLDARLGTARELERASAPPSALGRRVIAEARELAWERRRTVAVRPVPAGREWAGLAAALAVGVTVLFAGADGGGSAVGGPGTVARSGPAAGGASSLARPSTTSTALRPGTTTTTVGGTATTPAVRPGASGTASGSETAPASSTPTPASTTITPSSAAGRAGSTTSTTGTGAASAPVTGRQTTTGARSGTSPSSRSGSGDASRTAGRAAPTVRPSAGAPVPLTPISVRRTVTPAASSNTAARSGGTSRTGGAAAAPGTAPRTGTSTTASRSRSPSTSTGRGGSAATRTPGGAPGARPSGTASTATPTATPAGGALALRGNTGASNRAGTARGRAGQIAEGSGGAGATGTFTGGVLAALLAAVAALPLDTPTASPAQAGVVATYFSP